MAFTVADERCSILLFSGEGVVVSRNLIFWNQQTTPPLCFCASKKKGMQNKRAKQREICCFAVVVRRASPLESRSFRANVFFLSPLFGGANSKVFSFFSLLSLLFSLLSLFSLY